MGGQGGCKRRSEVNGKSKKIGGGGGGEVRSGMGVEGGVGIGRGDGGWFVARLGVGVIWGMGM